MFSKKQARGMWKQRTKPADKWQPVTKHWASRETPESPLAPAATFTQDCQPGRQHQPNTGEARSLSKGCGQQTSQELSSEAWNGLSFGCSALASVSLGCEQLALQVWVFNAGNFSINLRVVLFFFHFSPQETKIKYVVRDNFYIAVLPA